MNDIFRNDIEKYSQVRLDDIIVYSKTQEEICNMFEQY